MGGWEVHTDAESQHLYYYNPATGESRWEAPDEVLEAKDEQWVTPVQKDVELEEYDSDDFEVEDPRSGSTAEDVPGGKALGRVESSMSVATDYGGDSFYAGPGNGRGDEPLDPLEHVTEVEEVEEVEEISDSIEDATPKAPMRGQHIHNVREFGAGVQDQGVSTAKRDARGRIVVAPKAPVVRKFWEGRSPAAVSDSDSDDEAKAPPSLLAGQALPSAVSPADALRKVREERERIDAAAEAAERKRKQALEAADAKAAADRAKLEAESKAKADEERRKKEWNEAMARAKKQRQEQEAERRRKRKEEEVARRKRMAARAAHATRRASLAAADDSDDDAQPAPPKFKPGGALARMDATRRSSVANQQGTGPATAGAAAPGTALLLHMRGLGSSGKLKGADPGDGKKDEAGAARVATPPTIPKWMQNMPAPPKIAPRMQVLGR